ncbi:hypothetical protein FRB90_006527, partial [Tulasnella sp. 427]
MAIMLSHTPVGVVALHHRKAARGMDGLQSDFVVLPPFDLNSLGDFLNHVLVDNSESPYFAELLKETPTTSQSLLPVFKVEDDSRTLYAALTCLYSAHVQDLLDTSLFLKVIDAQEKYGIPETRLSLPILALIQKIRLQSSNAVDEGIDLFALTWRFGQSKACQFISRHTHSADLTDKRTVEKILRLSKGVDAYISLTDLHRRRELALDDVIAAMEPKQHLCPSHSASDQRFFAVIAMLKTAFRIALFAPTPICQDVFSFLGLQGTDGLSPVAWCSMCYVGADRARLTGRLQE